MAGSAAEHMPVGYSIYVDRPSFIHKQLDPRTKLAALGTTFVLALAFNHPAVLAALVFLVLLAGRVSDVPWRSLAPFLAGSIWFLVLGILIGPLFIRAIDVAQGLALAMDARGFGAFNGRSSIVALRITALDRAVMFGLLAACLIGIALRLLGIGLITRDYL